MPRPLVAALACLLASGPAAAVSRAAVVTTSNWAGYTVTGRRFARVSASWTVPHLRCRPRRATYSAAWVGLGGSLSRSHALEQAGVDADCSPSGRTAVHAWYELVPAKPVAIRLAVRPGDSISAGVSVRGSRVRIRLLDATRRRSFVAVLRMAHPDQSSADWILETPTVCGAAGHCRDLPLADFGSLGFTGAGATTTAGRSGSISTPGWSRTTMRLQELSGGRANPSVTGTALPGPLGDGGQAFSIIYGPA